MADNKNKKNSRISADLDAGLFAHKVIIWWLPLLYLLISSLFYLRTYDSAQVKISVMQMGGLALLGMWAVRLINAGRAAFSVDDLVCLSPFLAYLLIGVLSFLHAPYHMASVDFFLRHVFFMTVALIVIYEFDGPGSERLTKILIWTAWIAIGYGFLQFVDRVCFPPGIGKGIDPFIWRGAFGPRVFSTYGNPNFFGDFLVISFPILLMQYIKTRRWTLLPLIGMLLVDLVFTGTKGAWIGLMLVIFLFGVIMFMYFKELIAPYRKTLLSLVVGGILLFGGFVVRDLSRIASVSFRLFTWEATWEMIMTQPIIGTGIGSFPPIYPAFRRPPIFHIEGKHNTETDHSEDEYLEELFDNGMLGFGVFLWLIASTLVVGFRSLHQLTTVLAQKDGRPHPRAYDLIGYLVAFMGMLGHNFFDVSMRFVSSGVYLGLLSGMVVNLSRGKGLFELHSLRESLPQSGTDAAPVEPSGLKTIFNFLIWPARVLAWGALIYMSFQLCKEFVDIQGPLGRLQMGGEVLQWWIAWGVFGSCVIAMTWIFTKLVYLSENPVVALLVAGLMFPLNLFWGYFQADVHHNIAIFFSKERNWDQALAQYQLVTKLNPNFVMSRYFMGNVFNDRFDMTKKYRPDWGDTNNIARDDYERALDAYDGVRRLSPNYVQMHHQVGNLHMKRAEWAAQNGRAQEVDLYLHRALTRFKLYETIDPVYGPNFLRMGQVYMTQKNYTAAAEAYNQLIKADKCAVNPKLISKDYLRETILSYQTYVNEFGIKYPVHRHESVEAYISLANANFMLERWIEAEKAYRNALRFDPNNNDVKRNLSALYQKMQAIGRLRRLPPGTTLATDGLPVTGYEIISR